MTQPLRTLRLALFAATTALAAGAVVPTTAFAAPQAAPHAVVAEKETPGGNHRGAGQKDGTWGKKRPGKGGSHDGKHGPQEPRWQCVTAPCGPPGKGGSDHGKHRPEEPRWQCVNAPCGPPRAAADGGRTHPA
ncbi:hypothetical protein NRK68_04130 [Streptomyces yangpuensis]|uniref:Uncharacterized protein n=1 Tax=Streptomyces yangpuensis TaxID=1648182 RepID=A0ABY5PR41_9ACTN|nr:MULTISPECIES: hypothetical protein [Streptomyces]MBZ9594381.1 hypothetical protein [Streptomyces erythrochromogenes]UUY46474.1 hypothetical protein NRK68_04130 [Streptomyces yangpuensis]